MSLDNLSTTQTVTAPNTQTLISLSVPGTGQLHHASLTRQRWRRSQARRRQGRESNCTGTASQSSLDSVRVETSGVWETDRPDGQSERPVNSRVQGIKQTTIVLHDIQPRKCDHVLFQWQSLVHCFLFLSPAFTASHTIWTGLELHITLVLIFSLDVSRLKHWYVAQQQLRLDPLYSLSLFLDDTNNSTHRVIYIK